jgi:hypothetical protein
MLLGSSPSSGGKNGCPTCAGEKNTVQFNWQWAQEAPNGDLGGAALYLKQKKKWKSGFLFQCSSCGQSWYLDDSREKMTFLLPNQVRLMEAWGSTILSLSDELFKKVQTIGATPPHLHARQSQYAEVPCRVQTRGGEWIDKCLLTFTSKPPLENYYGKARLISDIADLQPSAYALSSAIRLAASRSEPNEKGQALTLIETPEDKRFWLNWSVNFVDRKGVKNQDLRLANLLPKSSSKRKSNKLAVLQEPIGSITFFTGDWSEKIRELLIK